ncbi:MAG TPA: flagellar assembly protein FliW [Bacteroidota bacterium]|nr:flagellar assembly protein FliW [Bacteroidota bacterium]
MKWKNHQFGEFEFDDDHVLTFPEGIIGFEECRRFVLVNDEDSRPFHWLVSVEEEGLSFPLIDPRLLIPEYAKEFGAKEDSTVLVVATIREDVERSTVNLRSPVVISNVLRTGKQVIIDSDSFAMEYPLFPSTHQSVKG